MTGRKLHLREVLNKLSSLKSSEVTCYQGVRMCSDIQLSRQLAPSQACRTSHVKECVPFETGKSAHDLIFSEVSVSCIVLGTVGISIWKSRCEWYSI